MATLYGIDRSGIARHIKNIFEDGELEENSTCAIFAHMGNNDKQTYNTRFYNLDMIISVGYCANSTQAINFRRWATSVLKEFAKKGYIIDRKKYLTAAKTLNIPDKTAEKQIERYLQGNLIERIAHGVYRKR